MLLKQFVDRWQSEDSLSDIERSPVDLVVPICYAMSNRDQLSLATIENMKLALNWINFFPQSPLLGFGNCSYTFPGAEAVESRLKWELFPELRSLKTVEVTLRNSVEEAEAMRRSTEKCGIEPKCILIVTGQLHSRSARFIWQKVFPNAKILVRCIGYENEVEPDHLIPVQRTLFRWIFVTLGRQLLLRTIGLRIRHLHHRTSG